MIRLGVNLDHVATLRNARGENDPNFLELMFEAEEGGAQQITVHLREDRRHIQEQDVDAALREGRLPINLEMALTKEMVEFALTRKPESACLVPERREELTTEGGLDLNSIGSEQRSMIQALQEAGIRVFPFIDADVSVVEMAAELGCDGVEIHTGPYARAMASASLFATETEKIKQAARICDDLNLECHAGHGLNRHNLPPLLSIANLREVNIGHSIIARALKIGLRNAVSEIKDLLL